ncbi:serine acetyltransferase [Comamonas serinivorans]|uniref:serine O-acetyltransferase n=1 Tax=Comamonas serinivorans TaxID=1082851 RepID=A0A1Y0ELF8_9BURK|nr:serine O-acetyltransferase EpsC [Comamonas serinivorans]ARU04483.1 serine acetyltransferase [Comamonas serinivorans]
MNKPFENLPVKATGDVQPDVAQALGLDDVVARLRDARNAWRAATHRSPEMVERELPSVEAMADIVLGLQQALFPMRLGPSALRTSDEDAYIARTLARVLGALEDQVRLEQAHQARLGLAVGEPQPPIAIVRDFAAQLPQMRVLLDSDVMAAFHGDPAARSVDEVLLAYPGIHAMIHHRIAHQLYRQGMTLLARLISEQSHGATGIDIHPGAQIGPGLFIDHGTGVVIGETVIIGRNVRIYQAVTLGAKRFASDENGHLVKGGARHPMLEDDVVVYAGATILGRVTIGRGSSIGGNVWLTRSVPPGSHIAQALARDCGKEDDGLAVGNPCR